MKTFDRLLEISERLLAPNGCPWDRQQTIFTLQPYLLEEMHELIEAIDSLDSEKIVEELGDVLYTLIFLAKIAEKEGRFTLDKAVFLISEKLIRRHPHVFGDTTISSSEEVVKKWEEIKKGEKSQKDRKKIFDGIPPSLPILSRAQKIAGKLRKSQAVPIEAEKNVLQDAEELGEKMWELVCQADRKGIDVESSLRRYVRKIEVERG